MRIKKSSRIKPPIFVGFLMWYMISGVCLPLAWPQTEIQFSQVMATEQAASKNPRDIKSIIDRIKKDLVRARQNFQSSKSVLENSPPGQIGATQQEVNQKIRLLKRKIHFIEKHIEAYRTLEDVSHDERFSAETDKGPDKYGKGPPYTISIVDQFREDIFNLNSKIDEKNALRSLLLQNREQARKELNQSEKGLRLASEALERTRTGSNRLRVKWLRDLAFLENEVARLRNLALKTQIHTVDTIIVLYRKELSVVEQHFTMVSSDVIFTPEELNRKLQMIDEEKKSLEPRYKAMLERDNADREKLKLAREQLITREEADPLIDSVARRLVEVLKAKAETSSQISDMYYYLISSVDIEKILWKERYRLYVKRDNTELKKAVVKLESYISRIREFQAYIISSVELSHGLVYSQEKQVSDNLINEKEKSMVLQVLDSYRERAEFLSGNLPKISEVIRNTDQFLDEIRGYRKQLTAGEHFFYTIDLTKRFMVSMWNYELFVVDDTIFINGEKVTGQRAITTGKILTALLILIIGFRLSAPLTRKAGALASRVFHASPPWVLLTEKTVHIVIFISLVIFALVTVKIPLTIFAFMGGALAIGVGFGAQNLINNFISGIILLMEQPIKVDDIIEIEGMSGKVVNVGTRCSQIKRFDGIDILVPNSDFLQKSVINWTLSDSQLRVSISFGVAYGSSTRDVTEATRQVLGEHGRILKKPEPQVLFEDFGDSALIFTVLFWVTVNPEMSYRVIASDVRHMLSKTFADAGIVIPFPQHDVHLDAEKPISVSLVPAVAPDHILPDTEDDTEKEPVA